MVNGSGVSRGDRNRNARLARLRELVPLDHAIVGIDLADEKQMVAARLTAGSLPSPARIFEEVVSVQPIRLLERIQVDRRRPHGRR